MLFPFITGKNFAFRIIVEIVFALWLVLASRDKESRPKKSWLLGAVWIFVAVIALADVFGESPLKSIWSNFERMEGLLSLVHFALYFTVLTSVFHTQKLWDWFWATWVGSALIMCLYALLQLGGKITINQGGVRVDGTFGNAIYLAVFLVFTIFFSTFLFLRSKNKKSHLWYFVPVVLLQSFVLYHTATRGAVLGLLGGIIVTVVLTVLFDKASADKKLRKTSLSVLIGIVVFVGGFFAVRNTSFVKTSPVLARFASLSLSEVKTQGRYFIWPMAIRGSLERPILGWGQENFNYIFNKDYDPRMYNQELWFDRAHSAPLDWLVAGGLLGFISYLSLFFFALWYLWKDRHQAFSFLEKSIITGLIAGYAFQAIFVFDNLVSYILFFSVLAFIASKTSGNHIRFPESLEKKSAQPIISAVVTILFLSSLFYLNIRPIETAQTLIDALRAGGAKDYKTSLDDFQKALSIGYAGQAEIREQLASAAPSFLTNGVPADIQSQYVALTRREFEKQIAETPNDMRYHNFYGIFLRSIGNSAGALTYLNRAHELSPRKQAVLLDIAGTYVVAKDYTKALDAFKQAYELETSNQNAALAYGVGAIYADQNTLAQQIFSRLPRETVLFDDRIVGALADKGQYSELVSLFKERIAEGQDSIQNNVSLAVSYYRLGDTQNAIGTLTRLAQNKPEYKADADKFINDIISGKVPKQ